MAHFKTMTELKEWLNRSELFGKSFVFSADGVGELPGTFGFDFDEHEDLVGIIFSMKKLEVYSFAGNPSAMLNIDGYDYRIEYTEFNQEFTINE